MQHVINSFVFAYVVCSTIFIWDFCFPAYFIEKFSQNMRISVDFLMSLNKLNIKNVIEMQIQYNAI